MKTTRFIVVDIEATCWYGPPPNGYQEIISLGIVRVAGRKIEMKKEFIIQPEDSEISGFCTKLTGLTEDDVKLGKTLEKTFAIIATEFKAHRYPWGSWGNFDRRIIQDESERKQVKPPLSATHINLKDLWGLMHKRRRGIGLINAGKAMGIEHNGQHHNALDDAITAAEIFIKMREEYDNKEILN